MKTKTKTLRHKKLSSLLALALKDLAKQEKARNSVVYMGCFLERDCKGRCIACLAGSVMRYSLGVRPPQTYDVIGKVPDDFNEQTTRRLYALDALRLGLVESAARELGIATILPDRKVQAYSEDRDAWWADMRKLLKELREAGE